MPITATGVSVAGRQILAIADPSDNLLRLNVVDPNNSPSAPFAKYYGYISVEYPQPSTTVLFQVGGASMWTLGKFYSLPFVSLSGRRLIVYWRHAGLAWSLQTFA